jgi:alkaline phosphatase
LEMTKKAIDILSTNEKGFFLMVEGSYIDWAGHRSDSEGVVDEAIDFDDAIGTAMDFAIKDGKTLVVMVTDHDTGAYTVLDGSIENRTIKKASFLAMGSHSANMVPIFAYGPGSSVLGGIHDIAYAGQVLVGYMAGD